jgi:hypothetical protein
MHVASDQVINNIILHAPAVVPSGQPFLPTSTQQAGRHRQFVPEQVTNIHHVVIASAVPFIVAYFDQPRRQNRQFVPEQIINTAVEMPPATGPSANSLELSALATQLQQIALILQGIAKTV